MKDKIINLIERVKVLGGYNEANSEELSNIFEEYSPIIKELFKQNPGLHHGEYSAFGHTSMQVELLQSVKSKKQKMMYYGDILNGLKTDLENTQYRIKDTGEI